MRKLPRVLVLWGVPGVGKSTYARWIAQNKGFTYIETDAGGGGSSRAAQAWRTFLDGHSTPEEFVKVARYSPRPVVVEFGMYADSGGIAVMERLRRAGAEAWWFDGNRDAAFEAWQEENVKASRNFDRGKWQEVVAVIDASMPLIDSLFGDNIVRTIEAGPVHVLEEETFTTMFGVG